MAFTQKYPITLQERLALKEEESRFSGSFKDFIQLLEVCDYPIEFQEGTIIAMSIASDPHEQIVANFLYALVHIFKGNKNFRRYGSNRHVYLKAANCAYAPDASVVKGKPQIYEYSKGKTAKQNPWLIVEVLSKSTRTKDLGEKLPRYKKCKSLEYIIFAEQDTCLVTVYSRINNSRRWQSADYDALNQSFQIDNHIISVADIYDNIDF